MPNFSLSNVYVAGRRFSGVVQAEDEKNALRRFVARHARELGVDVAASIVQAKKIGGFKAGQFTVPEKSDLKAELDELVPDPNDYTDWPAMRRS
jgi:hypothetical protein